MPPLPRPQRDRSCAPPRPPATDPVTWHIVPVPRPHSQGDVLCHPTCRDSNGSKATPGIRTLDPCLRKQCPDSEYGPGATAKANPAQTLAPGLRDDPDLAELVAAWTLMQEHACKDGQVGINDSLILLAFWGPCTDICLGDLNGDGTVGIVDVDFLQLLGTWGFMPLTVGDTNGCRAVEGQSEGQRQVTVGGDDRARRRASQGRHQPDTADARAA